MQDKHAIKINAGIPISKPAHLINQVCGNKSGLRPIGNIWFIYQSIKLGESKYNFWRSREYVNSTTLNFL